MYWISDYTLHFFCFFSLSCLFSTDETATENILKAELTMASLCGRLGLVTPRDAFITAICKASLPPHYALTVLSSNAANLSSKGTALQLRMTLKVTQKTQCKQYLRCPVTFFLCTRHHPNIACTHTCTHTQIHLKYLDNTGNHLWLSPLCMCVSLL